MRNSLQINPFYLKLHKVFRFPNLISMLFVPGLYSPRSFRGLDMVEIKIEDVLIHPLTYLCIRTPGIILLSVIV